MKNFRVSHRLVIAGALIALFCAQSAAAYNLLSPRRKWGSPPTYRVDNRGIASINDGDHGVTRTVNAITSTQAWNGANCGTVVHAQTGSMSGFSVGDGIPMLNFTDPSGACTGNCLALTYTGQFYYDSYLFRYWIYDADIVTNSSGFSWTSQGEDPGGSGCNNEFYVESVMTHEVGHGLGLAHSPSTSATMYAFTSACSNAGATIELDDRNGLRATSPPPVVNQQCVWDCYDEWDQCIGPNGGQDPAEVQRCDYYLENCYDTCMCN